MRKVIAGLTVALIAPALALCAGEVWAQQPVGVVSHVKVLSDKVEDVSSLDAWKASFIKDGMSDRDKGIAIWKTVVMFQHQNQPPDEYIQHENNVLDPIKLFNVYGYSLCSVAAAEIAGLGRSVGFQARGWTIKGHCLPELYWNNSWHMLDASLINYFPKPDGEPASVDEIIAAVKGWLDEHPDFRGNKDNKLYLMGRTEDGWGWKKGPALLAACPFYGIRGWWPAKTHGWYSTMQEYDGSVHFLYESGYSTGYQVNVQLRPGMRLTRNWSNKGLHVNMDHAKEPGVMKTEVGKDDLVHSPGFGDLAPGRIGNGTLEYEPALADAAFRSSTLTFENLASKGEDKADPAVHVKDPAQPGVLVIRMPSSYVYLSGQLTFKAVVGQAGEIAASFSENNGLDWKEIAKVNASGEQSIDLKPLVFRRYDYRLKFEMKGAGTGLDSLKIFHDVQHSQRPLPALALGKNTITFSAEPQEGTITIEPSTDPGNKGKNLVVADFHPAMNAIGGNKLGLAAPQGDITFTVQTPGDMTRVRIHGFCSLMGEQDKWDLQVSFDGGKTFKTAATTSGPARFGSRTVSVDAPPATRSALVRFAGTQKNTAVILNMRIDADYVEPHGGFAPVQVTYVWTEDGVEKKDVHVARSPRETYAIECKGKPVMKSLIVELAK